MKHRSSFTKVAFWAVFKILNIYRTNDLYSEYHPYRWICPSILDCAFYHALSCSTFGERFQVLSLRMCPWSFIIKDVSVLKPRDCKMLTQSNCSCCLDKVKRKSWQTPTVTFEEKANWQKRSSFSLPAAIETAKSWRVRQRKWWSSLNTIGSKMCNAAAKSPLWCPIKPLMMSRGFRPLKCTTFRRRKVSSFL